MSTSDTEKRQRSSAKGRFTRLDNLLNNNLTAEPDVLSLELVFSMLDDLKDAWNNVNVKHESYLDSIGDIDDEASNEHETWIRDIQNRFYEMRRLCNTFKKKLDDKVLLSQAIEARDIGDNNFRQVCINIDKILSDYSTSSDILEKERSVLCHNFNELNGPQNKLSVMPG